MRNSIQLLLFMMICSGASVSRCQINYYSPENIYRFAEHLYQNGDYLRAAGEYQRFLYSFDTPIDSDSILYKIGLCYQKAPKPEMALNYYQKIMNLPGKNKFSDKAHYQIALTYFEAGEYRASNQYIADNLSKLSSELAQLKMNQLLGVNYLFQKQWQTASKHFSSLIQNQPESSVDPITMKLNDYARQGTNLPHKSKFLAGILSAIVPGTGKMYAGRFSDGFYSLILVGITGWQAYEGFHKNGLRSVKGWIYGPMATIFYAGNIYGSVVAVKLINERTENNFIQKINIDLTWK